MHTHKHPKVIQKKWRLFELLMRQLLKHSQRQLLQLLSHMLKTNMPLSALTLVHISLPTPPPPHTLFWNRMVTVVLQTRQKTAPPSACGQSNNGFWEYTVSTGLTVITYVCWGRGDTGFQYD